MNVRVSGGTHKGRRLRAVKGADLRPTSEKVRAAIFSIIGSETLKNARILDLYAGTGIFGIESLSRGAAWAEFVEMSARRCRQLRDNLCALSLAKQGHVCQARVEKAVGNLSGAYNLVFADPPYDAEMASWLMDRLGRGDLIEKTGLVVMECRSGTPMARNYGILSELKNRRYGDTSILIYGVGRVSYG